MACDHIESMMEDALEGTPHIDRIAFRVKGESSFLEKAEDYEDPLKEIEDQIGGRVIVFFVSDIAVVCDALGKGGFHVVERESKHPPKYSEFDYESVHYVCLIPVTAKNDSWEQHQLPTTFEIQVRTIFMHAFAEPQHDLKYKNTQQLTTKQKRKLSWIAASAWGADEMLNNVRKELQVDGSQ